MAIPIYNQGDIEGLRKAGQLAATLLDILHDEIQEGVSTQYLDDIASQFAKDHGAIAAPLNYQPSKSVPPFPKSICTSVNEVVCHGIPSPDHILKDGDIINIDVTLILNGYYGDTSRMYKVGNISSIAKNLCRASFDSMHSAINTVKEGSNLYDIAEAITSVVKKKYKPFKFSIIRDFCGHGIGKVFHDEPQVMHYISQTNPAYQKNTILKEGMVFTIEPMINQGKYKQVIDKEDKWTSRTADKKLSAQFEHTMVVTKTGVEIFTLSPKGLHKPFELN